jgi:Flp pilus assembly pilin Flp
VLSLDQKGRTVSNRQVTRVITCSYSREPCRLNGPLPNGGPGPNLVTVVKKSCRREAYRSRPPQMEGEEMAKFLKRLWSEEEGQDIAEYAVMLAVILVIVVGTIRLIGGNANNVFSSVSSSIGS